MIVKISSSPLVMAKKPERSQSPSIKLRSRIPAFLIKLLQSDWDKHGIQNSPS
jgi:hypothetical protein